MATNTISKPFLDHKDVPTPKIGDTTIYTILGSVCKFEKLDTGIYRPVPYDQKK